MRGHDHGLRASRLLCGQSVDRVYCVLGRMSGFDDVFCLGDFRSCSVGDQQELIRLERCLVLHNTVLRNSYAEQARSQCAY